MNAPRIRALDAADLENVLALWRGCEGIGLNESDTPEQLTAYLARNPGQSFVAVEAPSGRIIGAVLCGNDGRRGYLHHLAVDPSCRRRGVGRLLTQSCLDALRKLHILKCGIFVYADNPEGQRFWSSVGWKGRGDLLVMQTILQTRE